ncbi:MAG: hypothetical protein NTY77_00545 [Elusimicrobia bacterium]|nr:hypothetical protein [Elusimicrobiota bacterium]
MTSFRGRISWAGFFLTATLAFLCAPASEAKTKSPKSPAAFHLPACQRPKPDEFVFGLVGPGQDSSDDFGLENLRAVSEGVPKDRLALFAPAPSTATHRSSTKNPYSDPLGAADALKGLAARPQKTIRLLFTGHGWPEGVWLGTDQKGEDRWIGLEDLTDAVTSARRAGKTVKGQFLTCYGGRFAEALMPAPGLAPACGVFSTLPEKKAEGCYEDRSEERLDYLFAAARADACGLERDYREVHGRVVAQPAGYDIPMLSSDYFLLYGPAARWLGRQARAPYPYHSLARKLLPDGTVLYADLVNARVVKALRDGRVLPQPEVSVVGCQAEARDAEPACDGLHQSAFFLHRAVADAGWPPADCIPILRLAWSRDGAVSSATLAMAALPEDEVWDPEASSATAADFQRDLSVDELLLPVDDLKPEARLILARLLPLFQDGEHGEALARRLEALAEQAQSQDPPRGRALRALISELRRRVHDDKASYQGTRFWGSWLKTYLIELANANDTQEENLDYSRLAFLTAVTVAERALREEARSDETAQRLVADLEGLRACERGLP